MKIIDEMITLYVCSVLDGYVDEHDESPDELSDYDSYIDNVRLSATRHGHFELLRLGLGRLLADPTIDLAKWMSWRGQEDQEARVPMEYMYRKLWPDAWPLPQGGPPGVEVVPCPWEVWNVKMSATLD